MPFHVWGQAGCNNRSELPLSLLVNVKLRDKSEPDFMAHVGDVGVNITAGGVFFFLCALAPHVSSVVREGSNKKKKKKRTSAPAVRMMLHLISYKNRAWPIYHDFVVT